MSSRILVKLVRLQVVRNPITKAYSNFSKHMLPFTCSKNLNYTNFYACSMKIRASQLSTTTEDIDKEDTTEDSISTEIRQYSEDEIQAVFDGGAPRDVPKKNVAARTVPVETSIRYLDSVAFTETYGEDLLWKHYRRNHKGRMPPKITREKCIRSGKYATGNPCPICRDDFLVIDYQNLKLLNQFINEFSGDQVSFTKTGVCMKKHFELQTAIYKAKEYGLLKYDVPFRKYNYEDYYPELKQPKKSDN